MTESEHGVKETKIKRKKIAVTTQELDTKNKEKARKMERASLSFYAIFVYIPVLAAALLNPLLLTLLSHIELLPILQNPRGFTFSDTGLTLHAKPRTTAGRGQATERGFLAALGSGSRRRPPTE